MLSGNMGNFRTKKMQKFFLNTNLIKILSVMAVLFSLSSCGFKGPLVQPQLAMSAEHAFLLNSTMIEVSI